MYPADEETLFRDELMDKGFLITSSNKLIAWARTGSIYWMTFGLACCAIEMMQIMMPRYDLERVRFLPSRLASAKRFDDCRRHTD
jgi:NADH-quinone oxidoreductase subunit B